MPIRSKFLLGQLCVSEQADSLLSGTDIGGALERHAIGDWGGVDDDVHADNDLSLSEGGPLYSQYENDEGVAFVVWTDAERRRTVVVTTEEFLT